MLPLLAAWRLDRHGTGDHAAICSETIQSPRSATRSVATVGRTGVGLRFDGGDITSDGGVLVLKKLEARTGIVRRFAACFTDYRKADQIEHPLLDRMFTLSGHALPGAK